MSLVIISTHPIQYHAPVYRAIQAKFGFPVTVIYGSDFSLAGYHDKEFGATFAWDTDLLSGYQSVFLSKVEDGGAGSIEEISTEGLSGVLDRIKPKVVMLLGYSSHFYSSAFWRVAKSGYPIIFRGETTDHALRRNFLKRWIRDHILRSIYRKCAKLLYVGKLSYQHFKRLGCVEEKLVFSPYCVDIAPFHCDEKARIHLRQITREELGITENQKVIIFSGKLSRRKGVDLLIESIKELPSEISKDVVVLFLGSGKMEKRLKVIAQIQPFTKTIFVGFKNQTQMSPYYHAADLCLLPSRHSETWGLVVNEALHHGVPCIVSEAVGCAPDLIKPGITGEIFKTGSTTGLSSAIQRALSLINRPDIREECRKKVSEYTVEKAAEGIAKSYWDIIGMDKR